MARVSLQGITKTYDGRTPVLAGIDLEIADGEFVVLVGPSGCGKSTLLRMLCGLESISEGALFIDDRVVNELTPAQRGVAMVFQSYALYPHMTVRKNMAFGLKIAGAGKAEIEARIARAAATLQIDHLLERYPRELSGGQRQRVAIGRAIVREPRLFLFDEPLSNLDAALRVQTRQEIARLHRQLGRTIVYVTHDQVEAMTLGDKIVVLHEGRVQQAGTPLELYQRPANLFVAGFIGSPRMNLLPARVIESGAQSVRLALASGGGVLHACVEGRSLIDGQAVTLGLRAEHVLPAGEGSEALRGTVQFVEHLGEANLVYLRLDGGDEIVMRGHGDQALQVGQRLALSADPASFHVFNESGQALNRLRPGNLTSASRRVAPSEPVEVVHG